MKTVLCAIAKCENRYIMEWITWHLKLRFDKIIIYDNNDINGERIRDAVGDLQGVQIIEWIGKTQSVCETQVAAYNDCYKNNMDADWIMYLDIDEFLEFNRFESVHEYLSQNWIGNASVIKFHWKCYTDNGLIHMPEGCVIDNFTELCTDKSVNRYTKSFYHGGFSDFKMVNVHFCAIKTNIYYQDGRQCMNATLTTDDNINYACGWVRHYVTKSAEEFVKIKYARRNPGASKVRLNVNFYFKYNKYTKEKDEFIKKLLTELEWNKEPNINIKVKNITYMPTNNEPAWCRMVPPKKKMPSIYELERLNIKQKLEQEQNTSEYPFGVSVCISAWNTAEYIEECLDSVVSQSWFKEHDCWEILLGIDGCEKTLAKVKEIMHKYKNLKVMMMDKNAGTYVTCNTIMKTAKYEWLLRFDSDDVMPEDMIEKIFMNDLSNVNVVRYKNRNFGSNTYQGLAYGSHMVKKRFFLEYGGYRDWRISADYDFIYRVEPDTNILKLENVFYNRRVRDNSLQFSKDTCMKSEKRKVLNDYVVTKSRDNKKIKLACTSFIEIPSMNEKIAFIIPNRGGTHINDVIKNIKTVYADYNKEILIINQCDEEPFKKGQLINIGILETDCDWIALSDNDIIHFNKINLFDEYVNNGNKPYLGFTYITQINIENDDYIKLETKRNDVGAGGFLFGKRNDFLNVNGFSNLYYGWGCEDNEMSCRLCNNNSSKPTLKHLDQELGHITHPKRLDDKIFYRNRKIFYSRQERNNQFDGINQMRYDILSKKTENDIIFIDVYHITVVSYFKYKSLL